MSANESRMPCSTRNLKHLQVLVLLNESRRPEILTFRHANRSVLALAPGVDPHLVLAESQRVVIAASDVEDLLVLERLNEARQEFGEDTLGVRVGVRGSRVVHETWEVESQLAELVAAHRVHMA